MAPGMNVELVPESVNKLVALANQYNLTNGGNTPSYAELELDGSFTVPESYDQNVYFTVTAKSSVVTIGTPTPASTYSNELGIDLYATTYRSKAFDVSYDDYENWEYQNSIRYSYYDYGVGYYPTFSIGGLTPGQKVYVVASGNQNDPAVVQAMDGFHQFGGSGSNTILDNDGFAFQYDAFPDTATIVSESQNFTLTTGPAVNTFFRLQAADYDSFRYGFRLLNNNPEDVVVAYMDGFGGLEDTVANSYFTIGNSPGLTYTNNYVGIVVYTAKETTWTLNIEMESTFSAAEDAEPLKAAEQRKAAKLAKVAAKQARVDEKRAAAHPLAVLKAHVAELPGATEVMRHLQSFTDMLQARAAESHNVGEADMEGTSSSSRRLMADPFAFKVGKTPVADYTDDGYAAYAAGCTGNSLCAGPLSGGAIAGIVVAAVVVIIIIAVIIRRRRN
eukprot:PLAT3664.4.p1 GENE.PLAT3664.4~~PLAT3664.4.p1  ORF type:complete len:446 (-),score=112.16 PLAT3664.4:1016-2353(-)